MKVGSANLGSVFGVTVDGNGNIYLSHFVPYFVYSLGALGGGTGAVIRVDGATGNPTVLVSLPQLSPPPGDPDPGLGNLTWSCTYQSLYVTNFEDGRVYRIDPSAPAGSRIKSAWDFKTDTLDLSGNPEVSDQPGIAPLGERVWGVAVGDGKMFVSVWNSDHSTPGVGNNAIWSVQLDPSGDRIPNTKIKEIDLAPPILRNPVADLAFDVNCCLYAAQRTMNGFQSHHHESDLLKFCFVDDPVAGPSWQPSGTFSVGDPTWYPHSSAGGVGVDSGSSGGLVYATGDILLDLALPGNQYIYGIQGLPQSGGYTSNSVEIDMDGDTNDSSFDKTRQGSCEVVCSLPERVSQLAPCCEEPVCSIFLRSGQHQGAPGNPGDIDTEVIYTFIDTLDCIDYSIADGNGILPVGCNATPYIVAPYPGWKASLDCDPSARWINSTIDGTFHGATAQSVVYCHQFFTCEDEPFDTACITFCWAVDNRLGDPAGGLADVGVYLDNGPGTPVTPIPAIFGGHPAFQHTVTTTIAQGVIKPGPNRLIVYQRNLDCPASGVIYHARIDLCRSCVPPPWGMTAWWPLDETIGNVANDAVCTSATCGTDGTWTNGPTPVPGAVDGALQFDGVDDYVVVSANSSLQASDIDLTVDAWIYWTPPSPFNTDNRLIVMGGGYSFFLTPDSPLGARLKFSLNTGGGGDCVSPPSAIPANQWVHVAATLQQEALDGIKLYVDGVFVAQDAANSPAGTISPSGTVLIGRDFLGANPAGYFKGIIDEVELFCRALPENEIRALWQAGVLGKCKEQCWASSNRLSCGRGTLGDVQASIVNRSGVARTYSYTITETPGCMVTGMAYVPSTGTISVAPGATGVVDIGADASGASAFGQACFKVTFVNQSTGNVRSALGNVNYTNCDGKTPDTDGSTTTLLLPMGGQGFGTFQLTAGPAGADFNYQVVAVPQDAAMFDTPLSLGDLPAGDPIVGSVTLAPSETWDFDIPILWPWCGWFFLPIDVQLLVQLVEPADEVGPFMAIASFAVTLGEAANCPADLNGDGVVDGADLGIVLGGWGGGGSADLDGNGVVNGGDLGLLLGAWGPCL